MSSNVPVTAGRQVVMNKFKRRKKIKTPPGHPSNDDLIAAYFANGGKVEVCKPGVADGAMRSQDQGLTSSAY
jgi:predicted peroxiredoxin